MNINIETALNVLYQRQIITREQLLKEILRVKMTLKEINRKHEISIDKTDKLDKMDKKELFQIMKKVSEDELGIFPADRDDFIEIFDALKDIDLIEFVLEIYKNDRMGTITSPRYLSQCISERIYDLKPKKVLITEAEKHLDGLKDLLVNVPNTEITLTTQFKPMYILLQLIFEDMMHVKVQFESIYTDCLINEKFDYIYSLPNFSNRPDEIQNGYFTKDSDGIAIENMLNHLKENGTIDVIVPAKITFATMGYEKLRKYITDNFSVSSIYILPEGTFRPHSAIKTYFFSITSNKCNKLNLGTLEYSKKSLQAIDKKTISMTEFLSHDDWRIELLLAEDDEILQKFKDSDLQKVKLKEVAEVFRGKSILKKDTSLGNIYVLNISNIENGEIDYNNMDSIDEEERKIKRYELLSGDVVLSCRGTAIKSAVFEEQDKIIIASANLIIIRPKEKLRGEIIKIFFESPIGLAMIKSFQRGTTVMNMNFADIMEMEIPLLSIEKQNEHIKEYNKELKIYKETIKQAEDRWSNIKNKIYDELT